MIYGLYKNKRGERIGNGFFQNVEPAAAGDGHQPAEGRCGTGHQSGAAEPLRKWHPRARTGLRGPGLRLLSRVGGLSAGAHQLPRGVIIEAAELYDASDEKGTLKGSILATLQKKLVVNTTGVLFDLLGKCGDRTAITAAGDYLSTALYTLLRHYYRRGGGNEDFFAVDSVDFDAGTVDAAMLRSRAVYLRALAEAEQVPELNSDALTPAPGVGQSTAQVVHNVDDLAAKR